MSPERLAARLLQTFLAELDDQLAVLEGELLAMEREGSDDPDRMNRVFRVAHTLKGAARVADVPLIEAACHALESRLADARTAGRALTDQEVALLLSAVDALADAGRRLREGEPVGGGPLGELERRLSSGAAFAPLLEGVGPADGGVRPPGAGEPPRAAAPHGPAREPTGATRPRSGDPGGGTPTAAAEALWSSVRVESAKLDDLLHASGQLAITVARADGHPETLEALAVDAARWLARWRRGAPRLRQLLASTGGVERRGGAVQGATSPGSVSEQHLMDQLDAHLRRLTRELGRLAASARNDARALHRASDEVADELQRLRLRPFAEAVSGLNRMVRDIGAASGRQVVLQLAGTEVEADRAVLDALREALMHLVRNAVDHGIEPAEERARIGKPREGTVRVAARMMGAGIRVTVSDDGRGLDTDAVRERLAARGLEIPESEQELAEVLFQGGFSTRTEASEISGRGVGLDVVRSSVERIRGSVRVRWNPGQGTTFIIQTPLVLATQRMLVVQVGGQPLAIPDTAVARLLRLDPGELRESGGRRFVVTATGPVPLVPLAQLLGPPLTSAAPGRRLAVVILEDGERRLAVMVDALLDETELVVRQVERRGGGALPAIAGAATLPDGQIALVLHPTALVMAGLGRQVAGPARGSGIAWHDTAQPPEELAEERRAPRLLVVDDSITTRTLEQSVLEAAGYDVVTAVDGEDGWRQLQELGADLVITDVEMPRMDGFTLCQTIRSSRRFAQLPVVLVTSLEDAEHRARGVEVGADAYVVKSGFDQEALLTMVRDLLAGGRP